MKIFSYVVDHDDGEEPNPFRETCTLCRCMFSKSLERTRGRNGRKNIVELADKGDWVIGTGGASNRSAGNGKLVYAMRVDEKLTRKDFCSKYAEKKSAIPKNEFEKYEQFALISRYFWYFGANAIPILEEFKLEKNSRGFHYVDPGDFRFGTEAIDISKESKLERNSLGRHEVDPEDLRPFLDWLKAQGKPEKHGEPCGEVVHERKGCPKCKSSC